MILRDRCSTSYDLASLFRGRRSSLDKWTGKIVKKHWYEAVSSALNFPLLKDVSQNCFIFLCCQLPKLKKSRRIASFLMLSSEIFRTSRRISAFLMLSSSKFEEALQYIFVFKLAGTQTDR